MSDQMRLKVKKLKDVDDDTIAVVVTTVNGPKEAVVASTRLKDGLIDVEVIGRVGHKYYVRLPTDNVWVDGEQMQSTDIQDGW